MKLWLTLVALSFAANAQESYRIVREGSYWVRTETGAFVLPDIRRLKVISPGKVSTQGEARRDVGYVLKRRVRARNGDEARRLLAPNAIRFNIQSGWNVVTVGVPRGVTPELDLRVPRNLHNVDLQVDDGAVSAVDLEGVVVAGTNAGAVVLDRINSSVSANTGGGEIRIGRIGGRVKCTSGGGSILVESAGADSDLQTAGGEVFVREAFGPVFAASGGGNVHVLRALSFVTATTNGGLVVVDHAGGSVDARTSGGAIEVGSANGASCQSAAGTIQLHSVGGALRASTLVGSIMADIGDRRIADSFLSTQSGDITVLIPSTLALTVQAESESAGRVGKILSDFPEIRIRQGTWLFGLPITALGAINGGGPILRLSATGGIIYLKRQE